MTSKYFLEFFPLSFKTDSIYDTICEIYSCSSSSYILRITDRVDVYDGANETSDKLGSFCGYYPSQISSSGNTLLLVFHTDESNPPLPDTEPKPTGYRIIADIGKP